MSESILIKRFIAYNIDVFIVGVFFLFPGFIIISTLMYDENWNPGVFMLSVFVFDILVLFLYWYVSERCFNSTVGKKIMRLVIVKEKNANFLLRTIYKFVPFNAISFLITKEKEFWHDKYSNTKVIEKK